MAALQPLRSLLLAFSLCLSACGSGNAAGDGTDGDPPPGPVGSACADDAGCEDGLTCVTQLPDGFCSQACETVCPDGSFCAQVTVLGTTYKLCMPACDADNPCRD